MFKRMAYMYFSSRDWFKHCRSQTGGNLLQKSTAAALSCSEVCGVSLRCCVEVSSRHRHSTPLLSLSSTNSGKSAGEEHCTLLMEAKGTFSPRPAEMGRGRGGRLKGAKDLSVCVKAGWFWQSWPTYPPWVFVQALLLNESIFWETRV